MPIGIPGSQFGMRTGDTYAPGMVRDAVMTLKTLYPDYRLKKDGTIKPPGKDSLAGIALRQDYLDDLFAADR